MSDNGSVLVVEDDGILSSELIEVLNVSGFRALEPVASYRAALQAIDKEDFDYCVLDLDLGGGKESPFGPGEEGRRLLALLATKKVGTVIYSGHVKNEPYFAHIHGKCLSVSKLDPCEAVIAALKRL